MIHFIWGVEETMWSWRHKLGPAYSQPSTYRFSPFCTRLPTSAIRALHNYDWSISGTNTCSHWKEMLREVLGLSPWEAESYSVVDKVGMHVVNSNSNLQVWNQLRDQNRLPCTNKTSCNVFRGRKCICAYLSVSRCVGYHPIFFYADLF